MLRAGPVLATVLLCSVCLLAAPDRRRQLCSLDRVHKVESLNNLLPTQLDFSLYTPSGDDFQTCPSAALSCFADELSVLSEELRVSRPDWTEPRLSRSLRLLVKGFNKSESGCRPCELHPEKSPGDFLQVLLHILERINAENC